MEELFLVILKILVFLFLFCKLINKYAQVSEPGETNRILGKSFMMRTGNFLPKREERRN